MRSVGFRRAVLGIALGLATVLVGSSSAAAGLLADEPYRWGNYGVHLLIAEEPYEAARCNYDTGGNLTGFKIRRPIAFAFDRTNNIDHQYVGWQFVIQGTNDADLYLGTYTTVFASSIKKVWTSEQQPAAFLPRKYVLSSPTYTAYRIIVKMFWYYPSATKVDGKVFWVPEKYEDGTTPDFQYAGCPVTHP